MSIDPLTEELTLLNKNKVCKEYVAKILKNTIGEQDVKNPKVHSIFYS